MNMGPRESSNNHGLLRHELDSLCIVILIPISPLFEASWLSGTKRTNIIIEPRSVLGSFGVVLEMSCLAKLIFT